jgi:hypothetical protein
MALPAFTNGSTQKKIHMISASTLSKLFEEFSCADVDVVCWFGTIWLGELV